LQLLEENIGETLQDVGNDSLNGTPNSSGRQMGLHQTKKSLHSKEVSINRVKGQLREWGGTFVSDRGLIFRIYKEPKK
jgi:hypothetical protein